MSFHPVYLLPVIVLLLFAYRSKLVPKASGLNPDYLSITTCKSMRGALAILVIFHHLAQKTELDPQAGPPVRIGFLAVSVFLFLSGYGLQKSHMRSENYRKKFLLRRIPSVLFPYLVVTLLFWAMYAADGQVYSFSDVMKSFVNGEPIAAFSWYIINILIFYVAFWLLMLLFRKKYLLIILGAALWYGAYALFCYKMGYPAYWYSSSHLIVFGVIWATYEDKILSFIKKRYIPAASVCVVLFAALFIIKTYHASEITSKALPLVLTMAVSLLFVPCVILYSLRVRFGNRILEFLGECSLEIYLVQGLFIIGLRGNNVFIESELLWALATVAGSILLGYVLHVVFAKILGGYRRLLKLG